MTPYDIPAQLIILWFFAGIPLHGVNLILYALGTVLNLMFYFATKYFPHLYKQDHPVDHFFQV